MAPTRTITISSLTTIAFSAIAQVLWHKLGVIAKGRVYIITS